jgi:hypothetical protein
MNNYWENYDPSLPHWVDLESIGIEDRYEHEEIMSECCDAPEIGHTGLCVECREYWF